VGEVLTAGFFKKKRKKTIEGEGKVAEDSFEIDLDMLASRD